MQVITVIIFLFQCESIIMQKDMQIYVWNGVKFHPNINQMKIFRQQFFYIYFFNSFSFFFKRKSLKCLLTHATKLYVLAFILLLMYEIILMYGRWSINLWICLIEQKVIIYSCSVWKKKRNFFNQKYKIQNDFLKHLKKYPLVGW